MSFAKEQKHKQKTEKPKKEYVPMEFVNYSLTETQKEDFRQWVAEKLPPLDVTLGELTQAGYKVSITADIDNECYIVSVIGTAETPNDHLCMSSRSDSVVEAVAIAHYKVADIFKWHVWEVTKTRNNWG